jgi:peroxiredoxin
MFRGGDDMQTIRLVLALLLSFMHTAAALDGPRVGEKAPDFVLPMATKDTLVPGGLRLSSLIGKNLVILAFYPADWSGGCTKEMCTMRDNFAELSDLGASVLGISGDYIYSHREWAKFHHLQFPLLSDHDGQVARLYGSLNEESGYNRRTLYLIDRNGTIAYVDLQYNPSTPDSFEELKNAIAKLR